MEQSYVYEQEQYEEGITFKKIGYFFKKGWLRMVIYALVLALLTTVIAVPIKVFYKSEPLAQTSIEFIYDGVEEGLAPDGSSLDTNNIISPTVIAAAVESAELSGIITDISALREHMRVEDVESKEYADLVAAAANGDATAINTLRTYENYPTRFTIIISEPKTLGLSDDQAKTLLNKIVSCYYDDFQARFSVNKMFASGIYNLSDNEQTEFFDMYDLYNEMLSSMRTYLKDISAKNPTFVSTKNSTTFNQLLSELTTLESSYDMFNAFITANNVWRDRNIAVNALDVKVKTLKIRVDSQKAKTENLKVQIENFKPNTQQNESVGGSVTVTATYPDSYYDLQEQLTAEYEELRIIQNQYEDAQLRLTNLGEPPEDTGMYPPTDAAFISAALAQIKSLESTSKDLTERVNATVTDFYDTTFISSSVRQVLPPQVTRRSSSLNLLVIYVAAVIAGLLAAALVTGIKISKANSAKAAQENAEQESAEQQPEIVEEQSDVKSQNKTGKK